VDDSIAALLLDGCDADAVWPVYPGRRGVCLPPAERGNVLEFLDS
jgi:hypothetical protein